MNAWDLLRNKYGTLVERSQTIDWIWWHKVAYTSGTTTLLRFFNVVPATLDLGNMVVAGSLQGGQAFIIKAIRVHFDTELTEVAAVPGAANDIARLTNNGVLLFSVGQKNYGQWPLHALPGGGGAFVNTGGAGGEATNQFQTAATNGVPDPRAINALENGLLLEPNVNFEAQIQWATAQTLSSGTLNINVMLDGALIRPVQ